VRFQFGLCFLNTETRVLERAGEAVHLTPKAFDLLQSLVESRPRVLAKAVLSERLWPDTHVQEANLPNLVAEVRRALADDAREPRFLRTVHGFGYAFCGEAVECGAATVPERERPFVYRLAWEGGRVALAEGEYVLGRDSDSVVPIEAATVSRRHARLRIAGGEAYLDDLGSHNGTFLGEQRVSGPVRIGDGDEFRLGSVPFTFRVSRSTALPETRDL
jgi:DNA-binding winged helix-turn-helix (wHTH) protein